MTTPEQAVKKYITGMVEEMRARICIPDLPIEIHTHPDLVETVSAAVEELALDGVSVIEDKAIEIFEDGNVKFSVLNFYIPEEMRA